MHEFLPFKYVKAFQNIFLLVLIKMSLKIFFWFKITWILILWWNELNKLKFTHLFNTILSKVKFKKKKIREDFFHLCKEGSWTNIISRKHKNDQEFANVISINQWRIYQNTGYVFIIIYLNLRQRVHILNCISYNVCCRKRGERVM